MLSLALIALFAAAAIASLVVLVDSVLKLDQAWADARRELANEGPVPAHKAAIVVLRPVVSPKPLVPAATPFAAAA